MQCNGEGERPGYAARQTANQPGAQGPRFAAPTVRCPAVLPRETLAARYFGEQRSPGLVRRPGRTRAANERQTGQGKQGREGGGKEDGGACQQAGGVKATAPRLPPTGEGARKRWMVTVAAVAVAVVEVEVEVEVEVVVAYRAVSG